MFCSAQEENAGPDIKYLLFGDLSALQQSFFWYKANCLGLTQKQLKNSTF